MSTRRGSRPSGGASRLATGAGALVALTVLAYLPALRGGFIWDDDLHVTQISPRAFHVSRLDLRARRPGEQSAAPVGDVGETARDFAWGWLDRAE